MKNGDIRRTLPNLEFKWFGLWYIIIYIHCCTHMWFEYILSWGSKACLLCFDV